MSSTLVPVPAAKPLYGTSPKLPRQIDISARVIRGFEKLGWVWDARWPTPRRLARLTAAR